MVVADGCFVAAKVWVLEGDKRDAEGVLLDGRLTWGSCTVQLADMIPAGLTVCLWRVLPVGSHQWMLSRSMYSTPGPTGRWWPSLLAAAGEQLSMLSKPYCGPRDTVDSGLAAAVFKESP